ncbi:MAG TPA: ribonuclease III [Candidatus Acidoferrales bacterium]|jgi:ribonuclease-3|nr:ribonuclease III [Candidatus Acidoferrales bacterium]
MAGAATERLEELLGHKFQSPEWLERALTHSSWLAENPSAKLDEPGGESLPGSAGRPLGIANEDNEKLEFLGDAVLTLVVSESLLAGFPAWREGQLSKARASLVNANALTEAARRLGLGAHLRLGRGEEKTGGRDKPSILADAYEAIVAAVFLDGGLEAARRFVERSLLDAVVTQQMDRLGEPDHKSRLQEMIQARGWPSPEYRVIAESGPDHRKVFEVEVRVAGRASAFGTGLNKKEAEQAAAQGVIAQLSENSLKSDPADSASK